ncbi:DNA damage-binding protein 1 [Tanacetum coccineum]
MQPSSIRDALLRKMRRELTEVLEEVILTGQITALVFFVFLEHEFCHIVSVYLEIGDGLLVEKKHAQLEYGVSCLGINPIGDNPNYSKLAAVGMWTGISVKIFSLPDQTLNTKEHLGGEIIPRSVLLCAFEGIPYLLCALGDGHLLNFLLNTTMGQLTDRKKVSLGTQPITLRTFSSKSTTHVFAASDRPTVN